MGRDVTSTVILRGTVGSQAYGLARLDSDIDKLGVFAAPSEEFFGLHPPTGARATQVTHDPDVTMHEVGKFCSLALQCNPTILELLWLPVELYEPRTWHGIELVHMRKVFLSRKRVKSAYLGYATEQFTRLTNKQRFPDVPKNRIEKHARHLLRLLRQGYHLYSTGTLPIKVANPQHYFDFGRAAAEGDLDHVKATMLHFERLFNQAESPLPETPNSLAVEAWLRQLRKELLT